MGKQHSPAVVDKQAEQDEDQQCQGTQDGEQENCVVGGNVLYASNCTGQPCNEETSLWADLKVSLKLLCWKLDDALNGVTLDLIQQGRKM